MIDARCFRRELSTDDIKKLGLKTGSINAPNACPNSPRRMSQYGQYRSLQPIRLGEGIEHADSQNGIYGMQGPPGPLCEVLRTNFAPSETFRILTDAVEKVSGIPPLRNNRIMRADPLN